MGKELYYIPQKLSFDEFFVQKKDFDFFQGKLLPAKKNGNFVFSKPAFCKLWAGKSYCSPLFFAVVYHSIYLPTDQDESSK